MEKTCSKVLDKDSPQVANYEKTRLLPTASTSNRESYTAIQGRPRKASMMRKMCVMFSCVAQLFICNGIGYGLSVMYAELIVVFNAKRADAALVQSLNMGLSAGAGILYAGAIKKYGPGLCIAVASLISSVGLFVSAFANRIEFIIFFTGVVAGLGMCVNYLASFVTITLIFYEDPGLFLISMTCGTSLGQFVIPLLFELLISRYSWSGAFILLSGVQLNCLQFAMVIHCSKDFFYNGDSLTKKESKASDFCDVSLLKDFLIWIIWTNCLILAISANVEAWFIVDHAVSIGLSFKSGSLMVSAVGLGNLVGRLIGSTVRFKCTKTPTMYHWIYLFILLAAIHIFVIKMTEFLPLLLGCFAIGITMGTVAAQAPAIMYEASGLERYPQGMAMVNVMYGIGELVGALIGGVIKDSLGAYDLVFYIASGMSIYISITTAFAAFTMRRSKQKEREFGRNDYLEIKCKSLKE